MQRLRSVGNRLHNTRRAAGAPFFLMRYPLAFFFDTRPSAGASVALTCVSSASAGGPRRLRAAGALLVPARPWWRRAPPCVLPRARSGSLASSVASPPACSSTPLRLRGDAAVSRVRAAEAAAPLQTAADEAREPCASTRGLARWAARAQRLRWRVSPHVARGTHACGRTRAGSSAATGCSCATWRRRQPRKGRGLRLPHQNAPVRTAVIGPQRRHPARKRRRQRFALHTAVVLLHAFQAGKVLILLLKAACGYSVLCCDL